MAPDFRATLGETVEQNLAILEAGRVITRDNGDCFISYKGMTGLLIDAIRQLAGRVQELEAQCG